MCITSNRRSSKGEGPHKYGQARDAAICDTAFSDRMLGEVIRWSMRHGEIYGSGVDNFCGSSVLSVPEII